MTMHRCHRCLRWWVSNAGVHHLTICLICPACIPFAFPEVLR